MFSTNKQDITLHSSDKKIIPWEKILYKFSILNTFQTFDVFIQRIPFADFRKQNDYYLKKEQVFSKFSEICLR